MTKLLKIIGLICLAIVLVLIATAWYLFHPMIAFSEKTMPRDLITAQFIDFDRVYMISKFRSAAGHDFSHGVKGETCRSMKHYFNVSKLQDRQNNYKPIRSTPTENNPDITIYAPFDGKVKAIESSHTGVTLTIFSDKYPSYRIRLFHVYAVPDLQLGARVKAGQTIAHIGPKDGMDVSVEVMTFASGTILLSVFEVMTDQVFQPYVDLGFRREDFITSKQYRNAHPFTCGGPQTHYLNKASETFQHDKERSWTEDFVYLSEDPYPQPGQKPVHIGPPPR